MLIQELKEDPFSVPKAQGLARQTLAPVGGTPPRACSDVGLPINEHAAAGEGSVHFALLRVGYWNQHVVLQLLEHLQKSQRSSCITCRTDVHAAEAKTAWKLLDTSRSISAILTVLKCRLCLRCVTLNAKLSDLSESPRCSAQGRRCFSTTFLRTISNLPAGCGISSCKELLFLNTSS